MHRDHAGRRPVRGGGYPRLGLLLRPRPGQGRRETAQRPKGRQEGRSGEVLRRAPPAPGPPRGPRREGLERRGGAGRGRRGGGALWGGGGGGGGVPGPIGRAGGRGRGWISVVAVSFIKKKD